MLAAPHRLMLVFGTRPEAIKLAPLVVALRADPRFAPIIVNTGQHREMLVPILEWFDIQPHHTLSVMEPGQPLARLSAKLLEGLHSIMEAERPETVVVQGDTTTALMGALAAYYGYDYHVRHESGQAQRRTIHVAHIEAGLRTGNRYAPFPEEANRVLIGQLAHWHFAPTQAAANALAAERITERVYITGNTVVDALQHTASLIQAGSGAALKDVPASAIARPYILITGHRRENYGEGFQHMCQAILTLAKRFPTHNFVYPVHLNQHVQKPVNALLGATPNIFLVPPQDYPAFVQLMQGATLILTDSGGVQEEGPALGKPVLVMRDVTERPEGVEAGTAKLVGTNEAAIVAGVADLLENPAAYQAMAHAVNPYGDGHATQRILNLLAGDVPENNLFNPLLKPEER